MIRAELKTMTLLLLASAGAASVNAEEITEKFLSEGVTQRVGGYRPIRAEMDKEASLVTKAPEGLKAPKYGQIEIGEQKWTFIVDEPEEGEATLYVDTNGDGDLTNDPKAEWKGNTQGEMTMYSGRAQIELAPERIGSLGMYRFDPKDERRAQLKNTLLFYTDFGFEYAFALDGKDMSTFVSGNVSTARGLPIDRDGNGRISQRYEMALMDQPFNFTGTTYVFRLDGSNLKLEKADAPVDQKPMPPDLTVGKPALTFAAKTMEGTEVEFPTSFKGKVVMLDFWATWCGPCIGEIPHMKEAYAEWHDKGFEILGVSFDQENMEEKVTEFMKEKEITWPQIYEGKGWETSLGIQHDVSGIPFVLLVDGDTGEILADARMLRGPGLKDVVGKALEKKNGKSE